MPGTTDLCEVSGLYDSACCHAQAQVKRYEIFPLCQFCFQVATWGYVQPLNVPTFKPSAPSGG